MRSVQVTEIVNAVKELCQQANYDLPADIFNALEMGKSNEVSPVGQAILKDICDNAQLAHTEQMPICQDTGTAVVFVKLGQEV